jgi:hypothetical protein
MVTMATPFSLVLRSRAASRAALERAGAACEEALRAVFSDLTWMADTALGDPPDRLIVFRADPGEDQPRLVAVEFFSPTERRRAHLTPGPGTISATALYGDIIDAASRWAAHACPAGLAIAVDDRALIAYPAGHCGHWNGEPSFTLMLDHDTLAFEAPLRCCPAHVVTDLLERYNVTPPTRRVESECD